MSKHVFYWFGFKSNCYWYHGSELFTI
jgi:hypothetical protein